MQNSSDVGEGFFGLSSIHCPNITRLIKEYLSSISTNENMTLNDIQSKTVPPDPAVQMAEEVAQRNAVIYIVVVLFFYSFGIGIMMIKYMRKEAEEQEEFKMYRRYMHDTHDNPMNSTNTARLANRLALSALNMVNAIPQTSQSGSKVTFV
ncbi:uncharacterized protein [Parasteatoda tepidariorum]|uniref:uncharacterized protein n=1 Tax=Parasteatoda tepidariorum TaxID=114398 RepID=UPI00077FE341|nr:uncharacterized protein LOC107439992 [Parasteatoda tepidariorum]